MKTRKVCALSAAAVAFFAFHAVQASTVTYDNDVLAPAAEAAAPVAGIAVAIDPPAVDAKAVKAALAAAKGGIGEPQVDMVAPPSVPLPPAAWLLASGLAGLMALRRRSQ